VPIAESHLKTGPLEKFVGIYQIIGIKKMNYPSGNIHQIFAIMDCLSEPRSQSDLVRMANVSVRSVNSCLITLEKIGLIRQVPNKLSKTSYGTGWRKMWRITTIGREFKEVIRVYVEA